MHSVTERGRVRADWLYATVRECQTFAGAAFSICSNDVEARAGAFLDSLPAAEEGVEVLIQRGLLLEAALQYGLLAHRAFHEAIRDRTPDHDACTFVPAGLVEGWPQDLTRSAAHAFRSWSGRFAREFPAAHPLLPACRAEQFIETHYAESIRSMDIARHVQCPLSRLQRAFVALSGMSMREFQLRVRARAAVRLLETTDLKVEAIAREVGYGSKKDLYRLLRARVGLTPHAIRAQVARKAGTARRGAT